MTHASHQMEITSLWNYWPSYSEQEVNQKFRQETKADIITLLQNFGELTDREMAAKLFYADPNKVRPRRNELCKMGIVERGNTRKCGIGKKQSIAWRLNKERLQQLYSLPVAEICLR